MKVLRKDKPVLGVHGISDPVCGITDDGIIVIVFWDGRMWHEKGRDGNEETYEIGICDWFYLPKNWLYDDDFYSLGVSE